MKEIVSLFARNYEGDHLVRDEIVPGAEWVVNGEGTATRKLDGTCCLVRDRKLFKRYDAKGVKMPPPGFEPAQSEPDQYTGHWPGWIAIGDGREDKYHREAWSQAFFVDNGTYELCGPKVQNNPEKYSCHVLVRHGAEVLADAPRSFDSLREYFMNKNIEGIVWHHSDGRMVKIKGKDFGLKRNA